MEIKKKYITGTLLYGAAFFTPFGVELNRYSRFPVSAMFVIFSAATILWYILFIKNKQLSYPSFLWSYVLYTLVHSFIVYFILFPEELFRGHESSIPFSSVPFSRMLLFSLFANYVGKFIINEKRLSLFSSFYSSGFVIVVLLSLLIGTGFSAETHGSRFSGAYTNPNSLAATALMVFFLNIFLLVSGTKKKPAKWFFGINIFIALFCILISGSRAGMLGVTFGGIALFLFSSMGRKIQIALIILVIGFLAVVFVPEKFSNILINRIESHVSNGQLREERLVIWQEYIKHFKEYYLIGLGIGRSRDVVKGAWGKSFGSFVTHNHYFGNLVNFGLPGAILFFLAIGQIGMPLIKYRRSLQDSIIIGFLVAWLALLFFGDYYSSRDFWIFLGFISAYKVGIQSKSPRKKSNTVTSIVV